MITVLIGHRGVGKTSLLEQIRSRLPLDVFDLDQEIEKFTGRTVFDLFAHEGESFFRDMERQRLAALVASRAAGSRPAVIALGAGFEGPLPPGVRAVWIRRATDADGRIFLNRPRLNAKVSPLTEYMERFEDRESRYRQMADEILQLPEGEVAGLEKFFAADSDWNLRADLTLFPQHLHPEFIERRTKWGVRRFELRTDLLTPDQIEWVRDTVTPDRLIYSVRRRGDRVPEDLQVDWPLELGEPPRETPIVSLHERLNDFSATLQKLSSFRGILKLAVEVSTFQELLQGHAWWLEDIRHRAFLPRSTSGRWQWYRSLFGPQMPLHYMRESEGSSLDQPLFWQHVLQTPLSTVRDSSSLVRFAAVLGSPVHHSRTPLEHRDFFAKNGIPVVAIEVRESEWKEAFAVLEKLGLRFAAVTSPLKEHAFSSCETEADLGGVNTLVFHEGRWRGTNTDILGLQALAREVSGSVALWGGGGTLAAVKKAFPDIQHFSARTGRPSEAGDDLRARDTLIWAVGRGRGREFQWPRVGFPTQKIIDLNYTDNSPGLELAASRGLSYVSGLKMFFVQAEGQRQFWQRFL